jgi:hypothetical protein
MKGSGCQQGLSLYGRVILKGNLRKFGVSVCTQFRWLSVDTAMNLLLASVLKAFFTD